MFRYMTLALTRDFLVRAGRWFPLTRKSLVKPLTRPTRKGVNRGFPVNAVTRDFLVRAFPRNHILVKRFSLLSLFRA